jgi:antitoxin component of RelBE/YafQ-DinJ toxin-antitoxin module
MKVIINIKTEKEVKENAQKLAKELGISLNDVMNASLRNFIRTREVHFSHIPRMTKELEDRIGEARKDFALKKHWSPGFSSVKEAINYLNNSE